jgi:hypothetical protein
MTEIQKLRSSRQVFFEASFEVSLKLPSKFFKASFEVLQSFLGKALKLPSKFFELPSKIFVS